MCANLIHIFLIFCHIFEILKINYFSGFTALGSDRAIRYFYFFKLLYFVNTLNESNRSKLNVQSLISFECKIYLAWRIKMLNRSIFKIQFEVAD